MNEMIRKLLGKTVLVSRLTSRPTRSNHFAPSWPCQVEGTLFKAPALTNCDEAFSSIGRNTLRVTRLLDRVTDHSSS